MRKIIGFILIILGFIFLYVIINVFIVINPSIEYYLDCYKSQYNGVIIEKLDSKGGFGYVINNNDKKPIYTIEDDFEVYQKVKVGDRIIKIGNSNKCIVIRGKDSLRYNFKKIDSISQYKIEKELGKPIEEWKEEELWLKPLN